jgi:hypothetical protein
MKPTIDAVAVLREALENVLMQGLPVGPGYIKVEADARAALAATELVAAPVGVLLPIEVENGRTYIPLPGGWEVQTKGKGSTFRICHNRGPSDYQRWMVLDEKLHKPLEDMAMAMRRCTPESAPLGPLVGAGDGDTRVEVTERYHKAIRKSDEAMRDPFNKAITERAATVAKDSGEPVPYCWFHEASATVHRTSFGPHGCIPLYARTAPTTEASAEPAARPELTVWYGSMPESNGKSNFTAILNRKDAEGLDKFDGFTIGRSEYPERVRYEADCVRHLIGELAEQPWILDYDADAHSGYVEPVTASGQASAATQPPVDTDELPEDPPFAPTFDTYQHASRGAATQPAGEVVSKRLYAALEDVRRILQKGTVTIDKIHELGADGPAEEAWQIFYDEVMPLYREATPSLCAVEGAEALPLCVGSCAKRGKCIEFAAPISEDTGKGGKEAALEALQGRANTPYDYATAEEYRESLKRAPAAPSGNGDALPVLPEKVAIRAGQAFPKVYALGHTDDGVQAHAQACVLADRVARLPYCESAEGSFSESVLHAMYKAFQRGDSVERAHKVVMDLFATRSAVASAGSIGDIGEDIAFWNVISAYYKGLPTAALASANLTGYIHRWADTRAASRNAGGEFGKKITSLIWEIRRAKSLAWRDSLLEQLIELLEPSPAHHARPSNPVDGQGAGDLAGNSACQELREALESARNWFESQHKMISKGCGSTWDMLQCAEQRDAIEAALTKSKGQAS